MPLLLSNPAKLSPSDRAAAVICIAVAALMCGTACFNINLQLLDSKPVPAQGQPRASQSAATQKPGNFRIGAGADGVGFSPKSGEGTSTGQGSLNARVGVAPKGLELAAGFAVPVFQPYGMARYQLLGQVGGDEGQFLSAEAGGGIGDGFAGLSAGTALDKAWEMQVNGRYGAYYGDDYGEAGISFSMHAASFMDLVAGAGYRYYGAGARPNVTRGGVSLEFGPSSTPSRLQLAMEKYEGDPERLLNAREFDAAALVCWKKLKKNSHNGKLWELYSRILLAKGDVKGSQRALRKAVRISPAMLEEPREQPAEGEAQPRPTKPYLPSAKENPEE